MKKASELINAMIDDLMKNESQREVVSLFSSWKEIAGENEGAHSAIEEIENGIVIVNVDHPGWLQRLGLKKKNILVKLKKKYPELSIKNIRFICRS